jgi:diacylglycerol kinase family enzyme
VCIPAGTRNHFANDLGVDRSDVVGALDAFAEGVERRIDLARLNGRVFVNNASLGVYANIVKSERYRDAKLETVARELPELLPPRGGPFDLRFTAPDGTHWDGAHLVLVSNNPYRPARPGARGARRGIDSGLLGVLAIRVLTPRQLAEVGAAERSGALPRSPGSLNFTAQEFAVHSTGPTEVALDGEALVVQPPLQFESLRSALRVRVMPAEHRPALHPRAPQSGP